MKYINPINNSLIINAAQPINSQILTPSGWSILRDIEVGSKVIGIDGKDLNVTHINNCGESAIYKIEFSDGSFAECSPNHLWAVDKVHGKRECLILSANKIAKTFIYHSPGGQTHYKYRVPACKPITFDDENMELPLDPYLVGALIGNGSLGNVPSHCPRITSMDQEVVDQFDKLLPEGCEIRKAGEMEYRLIDVKGRQGYKHKSRARQAVVKAGIAGCRSYEKFIPDLYKMSTIENRLSLLQGLMDTDGSASGGVSTFHSCSSQLAEDVMFVVRSLGGTVTHNIKPSHRGYRDMHVLHIALPGGQVPFRLSRKAQQFKKRKHAISRSIISIELVKKQAVKCIAVDSEDGLYITDNFIVTHDSMCRESRAA